MLDQLFCAATQPAIGCAGNHLLHAERFLEATLEVAPVGRCGVRLRALPARLPQPM